MMSSFAKACGYWSRISYLIFHTRSFSCSYSSVWLLRSRISFSCSFCSWESQQRAYTGLSLNPERPCRTGHDPVWWKKVVRGKVETCNDLHIAEKLMPEDSPPQDPLVQHGVVLHSSPTPAAGTQIKSLRKAPPFLCTSSSPSLQVFMLY